MRAFEPRRTETGFGEQATRRGKVDWPVVQEVKVRAEFTVSINLEH